MKIFAFIVLGLELIALGLTVVTRGRVRIEKVNYVTIIRTILEFGIMLTLVGRVVGWW